MGSEMDIKEAAEFILDKKFTLNNNGYELQNYNDYRK